MAAIGGFDASVVGEQADQLRDLGRAGGAAVTDLTGGAGAREGIGGRERRATHRLLESGGHRGRLRRGPRRYPRHHGSKADGKEQGLFGPNHGSSPLKYRVSGAGRATNC